MSGDRRSLPIGVFDSGIGGLTVVRELRRTLPNESILYFGDTARLPYGPKSPRIVRRYAHEAADFLLSRGVKLMVVACNTATAHALDALRDVLPVPVVGVIEPGARVAADYTRSRRIGVLGTTGTVASGAYDRLLRTLVPDARIYAQPCPLFVPLVEEGFADHRATELIAVDYVRPLREVDVDVVILGCTHYPLLRPLLARLLGSSVRLVDSGAATARAVEGLLDGNGLRAPKANDGSGSFAVTDSPLRFREAGSRFVGDLIGAVEQVTVDRYDRVA